MAGIPRIDSLQLINASERYGTITRLVRRAIITNLESTDYQVIKSALTDLGIESGSTPSGTGFEELRLTERNPTVIDKSSVQVDLVYEHFVNDGQDLDNPETGTFWPTWKATVNQISTNEYPDSSSIHEELQGKQIEVAHTFPADDPDTEYAGKKFEMGGETEVFQPGEEVTFKGRKIGLYPWTFCRRLISTVNSVEFAGMPPRTWLCTYASYNTLKTTGTGLHLFTFTFELQPDGWDKAVVFIDPRTGQPPVDLIKGDSGPQDTEYAYIPGTSDEEAGVGYRVIRYLEERDFINEMSANLEGA